MVLAFDADETAAAPATPTRPRIKDILRERTHWEGGRKTLPEILGRGEDLIAASDEDVRNLRDAARRGVDVPFRIRRPVQSERDVFHQDALTAIGVSRIVVERDVVHVDVADGVIECGVRAQLVAAIDRERLIELIMQHRNEPLARIGEVVTTAVSDWIAGGEQPDDVTLVLARAR